jgi:hypothetical protein
MAAAKPANNEVLFTEEEKAPALAKTKGGPQIEYYGDGADKVKFTVDKNARLIRVYGDGRVLIDY